MEIPPDGREDLFGTARFQQIVDTTAFPERANLGDAYEASFRAVAGTFVDAYNTSVSFPGADPFSKQMLGKRAAPAAQIAFDANDLPPELGASVVTATWTGDMTAMKGGLVRFVWLDYQTENQTSWSVIVPNNAAATGTVTAPSLTAAEDAILPAADGGSSTWDPVADVMFVDGSLVPTYAIWRQVAGVVLPPTLFDSAGPEEALLPQAGTFRLTYYPDNAGVGPRSTETETSRRPSEYGPGALPLDSSPDAFTRIDLSRIDCEGFFRELQLIRRDVQTSLGERDIEHLRKIERVGRAATAVGLATAWVPNPVSMAALALGRGTRWLLMHHIGHRGYDRVPDVPRRYTSRVFAVGWRRYVDWADWMLPEAWKYEHNVLHHTNTGELKDPDLIERNTEWLRESEIPVALKYAAMAFLAVTWRSFYYAPNTVKAWLSRGRGGEEGLPPGYTKVLWLQGYLPYAALQFGVLPALFLPLGPLAAASALVNSLGAEALTNLHTFLVVGPNHTGEDLYRFDARPRSNAEAAVRQVLGSVNYALGSDLVDYPQLWLNYQIEHHLFPDIPMARYREIQPRVEALCAKYGIPYVKESVFTRAKKMLEVAVGKASMLRAVQVGGRSTRSAERAVA